MTDIRIGEVKHGFQANQNDIGAASAALQNGSDFRMSVTDPKSRDTFILRLEGQCERYKRTNNRPMVDLLNNLLTAAKHTPIAPANGEKSVTGSVFDTNKYLS